ncbi:UNVERIFIED_CONTAM: hypothetical protein FKN15_020829 [Acipenser sinensis]
MNTRCPPKRVPSADRFFSHCRSTMQPTQSYSIGGQRSSGQLTGKSAGARPLYRGRWCAVSRGHPVRPYAPSSPGGAQPIVRRPLGVPDHDERVTFQQAIKALTVKDLVYIAADCWGRIRAESIKVLDERFGRCL